MARDLGWWSVVYDLMLPIARDAAEERRNIRLASDANAAIRCLGFCIASAGALEAAYDLGWERGCVRASADATMEDLAASWISNTAGRPAPGTGGTP